MSGTPALRVMTWNIHGCIGTDRRRDPGRVAAAIGAARPDVLALQEIDIRSRHADAVHLLDLIAEHAGMHRYESYTISEDDRRYGIALYSRFPLHSEGWHDLAWRRREPRRAIEATVEGPGGPMRVIATHFGLSLAERRDQIARLRLAIGRPDRPTILLGDFNDWLYPGAVGRLFGTDFPTVIAPRSFPSRMPLFPLDRIFLSEHLAGSPLPLSLPAAASDHRAVAAAVRLRKD
jgi:endonuclease/exonuclease/phosphatase family metal-dependent hydrolase